MGIPNESVNYWAETRSCRLDCASYCVILFLVVAVSHFHGFCFCICIVTLIGRYHFGSRIQYRGY